MTGLISIVSSAISPSIRLRDEIKKYQSKKKTQERFLNALEDEIKKYSEISKQITHTSEQFMSILDSIEDTPTVPQLNNLFESVLDAPIICSQLIELFVELAKSCSEVSKNEAFMSHLKETDALLYDFVQRMRDTYIAERNAIELHIQKCLC